jgi:hypothetical protein
LGQVYTPFVILRGDAADVQVSALPGVSNYINIGQTDVGRVMPTAGLEYRYPLINGSVGTQTVEPVFNSSFGQTGPRRLFLRSAKRFSTIQTFSR